MNSLRDLQHFFSQVLSHPPTKEFTLHDQELVEKANQFISPSPKLQPQQCLEIYHKQYWWRLLNCCQNNFPLLARYLGATAFNRSVAIPYLLDSPPTDWTLSKLGKDLALWIEESSMENKEELVPLAKLEWAFNETFWMEAHPPLKFITPETPLSLQPHLHLFHLTHDLFSLREELLKKSLTNDPLKVPFLDKSDYYFILFRNKSHKVVYDTITRPEYLILSALKKGSPLNDLFETLALTPEEEELLPVWFYHWTSLSFFSEI